MSSQEAVLEWLRAYNDFPGQDGDILSWARDLVQLAIALGLPCYMGGQDDLGAVGWLRLQTSYEAGDYDLKETEYETLRAEYKELPLPWEAVAQD